MPQAIHVNLAIIQPPGFIDSLGFLDQARFFRHQFRRLGAEVSITKNRLHADAVNFVFGAHLGFPIEWQQSADCIFVNLEQLGKEGAKLNQPYLDLLRNSPVVEYDSSNLAAYAGERNDIPVFEFGYASYLKPQVHLPLEERPIDLLFFGNFNLRRKHYIERIETAGGNVTLFDYPVFGAERDYFISQAKAVLNCHYYESNRFEQARAFHCLSLGTPMISERTAKTNPSSIFENAVIWLDDINLEDYFSKIYNQDGFYSQARECLANFSEGTSDNHLKIQYSRMLDLAFDLRAAHGDQHAIHAQKPTEINLMAGSAYQTSCLNIDVDERREPDLVLDFANPIALPYLAKTRFGYAVQLDTDSIETIFAHQAPAQTTDLSNFMTNALALLCEGGELDIEAPYSLSPIASPDPKNQRSFTENSWLYFTDCFWESGWFAHRFTLITQDWHDAQHQKCARTDAAFIRLIFKKTQTTPQEKTKARTAGANFGVLEADE